MDKLHDLVLDVSLNATAEERAVIMALRSQGEMVAQTGITGSQFDSWATEIAEFEEKGLAQIEAVAADLAEAGLPRDWSVRYSYDVTRNTDPALAGQLQAEALELGQVTPDDIAGPLSAAHEQLENTVRANLENIAAGSRGDLDWVQERRASIEPD
jgi:hypothetical protein